jgi:hypothetical protein
MAVLFGLDMRALIGGALAGQLYPVTLHKATVARGADGRTLATYTDHAAEGVRLKWQTATAASRGYPRSAVKVLLLQHALAVAPTKDDHVTAAGARYRVLDVEADPGDAAWVLAVVPAEGGS